MVIDIIKNMVPAPKMGGSFGQDVEPTGTYVTKKNTSVLNKGWAIGKADIKKPLVVNITDDTLVSYKYDLSQKYKAKGKALTNKLMKMGYDCIMTQYPDGSSGEIILFPNCGFMFDTNESKKLIKNLLRESLLENSGGKTYLSYHGSPTKFQSFTDEFVGGKDATDQEGPGIYFTTSLENAMAYGKYVYYVELSPKKSVSTQDGKNAPLKELKWLVKMAPNWKDTAQNWDENPNVGFNMAINDFIQYNNNPHQQFLQVWFDFYRYSPLEYVRNMVKLGYDSILINNRNSMLANEENITHTIVLNPSIIKFIKMEDVSLNEIKIYQGHKIPVEQVFKNPNLHNNGFNSETSKKIDVWVDDETFQKNAVEWVDVNKIVPTQRFLDKDNLEDVKGIKVGNNTGGYLVELDGLYYVIDGHHRLASQIRQGVDKVKAFVQHIS